MVYVMDEQPEITVVGMKLLELGTKLRKLRAERDDLTTQITAIEGEIAPLLVRHTQLISEITGMLLPKQGVNDHVDSTARGAPPKLEGGTKQRVLKFLQMAEPGVGPLEVAEALRLDVSLVRQAMMEMARKS